MLRLLALSLLVAGAAAFSAPARVPVAARCAAPRPAVAMGDNIRELRTRIGSIKNTKKITSAMKLVAAAKVRRAQDAVIKSRPFTEELEKVIGGLIERLKKESLELPLLEERETKTVMLVIVSGERGLCGGYNAQIIKKATQRIAELEKQGIKVKLFNVGRKANVWFKRRNKDIVKFVNTPNVPTSEFASDVSDGVLNYFLSGEVDRVEVVYTSFISMIAAQPSVRTLVPLSPQGLETDGDEIFKLTTKDGKFGVEREKVERGAAMKFESDMLFEQEPGQLLNAILPLYINGQLLRTVQVRRTLAPPRPAPRARAPERERPRVGARAHGRAAALFAALRLAGRGHAPLNSRSRALSPRFIVRLPPAGVARVRARRAHERHAVGDGQRVRARQDADAEDEPRAPGGRHAGAPRDRRGRQRRQLGPPTSRPSRASHCYFPAWGNGLPGAPPPPYSLAARPAARLHRAASLYYALLQPRLVHTVACSPCGIKAKAVYRSLGAVAI